jgi:glucose-6-phosphate isomerase
MDKPFSLNIDLLDTKPSKYDHHTVRTLSAMNGQFLDKEAYATLIAKDNLVVYEIYEVERPHVAGELLLGVSIVHAGKVGGEFFMTKGHYHTVLDTAEVYYCLKGHGCLVMENPDGDWAVTELSPGQVVYVPPCWAHRSVNTSLDEDLITFFVYPGHSGHDYTTIEKQGFRKIVVEADGQEQVIDNPRWQAPESRQ